MEGVVCCPLRNRLLQADAQGLVECTYGIGRVGPMIGAFFDVLSIDNTPMARFKDRVVAESAGASCTQRIDILIAE